MDEVDEILDQNRVDEEEEEEEDDELNGDVNMNADEEEEEDEEGENEEDENNDAGDDSEDEEDEDQDIEDEDEDNSGDDGDGNEDSDENESANGNNNKENGEGENPTEDKMDLGVEFNENAPFDKVHHYYLSMLQSAKMASSYNIYPSAAIPIQANVNALAVSKGLKYLFLGGSDGYIRKFDLLNTLQGKLSLTILQKHSLTESIQNAGILTAYWENEIPQRKSEIMQKASNKNDYQPLVSPVYSLEVQDECMFLLSGLENGGITMQGVRYMEGSIGHYFKEHSQVVNILKLNSRQDRFISGSWDKRILEWDLVKTGQVVNEFKGNNSEISSLEYRPLFSTVGIKSNSDSNANGNEDEDEDDEIASLFGEDDEDEEEEGVAKTKEDSAQEEKNERKISDEISNDSLNIVYDENTFMTSGLNGSLYVWDKRTTTGPALNLQRSSSIPPWCFSACWSSDGDKIYAGRRNACVEEFDLKMPSRASNILKLPTISGPVSSLRAMPNGKHILMGSRDNIRLYDITAGTTGSNSIPFLIVPGHHGGMISNIYVDPSCRFMITTSGNRGWQGVSTDTTLIYEIDLE